jgi:hypothetical protein
MSDELTIQRLAELLQRKTDAEAAASQAQEAVVKSGLYDALYDYIQEAWSKDGRRYTNRYALHNLTDIEVITDDPDKDPYILFRDPEAYASDSLESATMPLAWLTDRIGVMQELREERLRKEEEIREQRKVAQEKRDREQLASLIRKYGVPS